MAEIVNFQDIELLKSIDPVFSKIQSLYGNPPDWARPQGFETLCKIILEQQVSLESANAHYNKLNSYLSSFRPEEIVKLSDEEMKNAQISRQKASYLKYLSQAILSGDLILTDLPFLKVNEIKAKLMAIKGIGNWTSEVYLMFCLQSKDILPIGDVAIINTIKELKNIDTLDEIESLTQKWSPLRTLASFFLWHYYLKKRGRSY